MNALVTYYSQTGNTLAIARALYEELSEHCSCTLQILDECGMSSLNEYDLILIGSPCHAGTLAAPVREFLSLLPDAPSFHLAGFITHASSVYQKSDYENSITFLRSLCSSKRISYHGCFECRGNLTADLHDFIRRKKNVSDAEWARMVAEMEGHPDSQDKDKARLFARTIIGELESSG